MNAKYVADAHLADRLLHRMLHAQSSMCKRLLYTTQQHSRSARKHHTPDYHLDPRIAAAHVTRPAAAAETHVDYRYKVASMSITTSMSTTTARGFFRQISTPGTGLGLNRETCHAGTAQAKKRAQKSTNMYVGTREARPACPREPRTYILGHTAVYLDGVVCYVCM